MAAWDLCAFCVLIFLLSLPAQQFMLLNNALLYQKCCCQQLLFLLLLLQLLLQNNQNKRPGFQLYFILMILMQRTKSGCIPSHFLVHICYSGRPLQIAFPAVCMFILESRIGINLQIMKKGYQQQLLISWRICREGVPASLVLSILQPLPFWGSMLISSTYQQSQLTSS